MSPIFASPGAKAYLASNQSRICPDESLARVEGAIGTDGNEIPETIRKRARGRALVSKRSGTWHPPCSASIGHFGACFRAAFADLTDEEREMVYDFVRRFFAYLETKKYKLHVRVFLSRYRNALCPECKGARLRKEALDVRVGGRNLAELVRLNIAEAAQFFDALALKPEETAIADKILVEIRQRLKFLNDVGLEYLTLYRLSSTLS